MPDASDHPAPTRRIPTALLALGSAVGLALAATSLFVPARTGPGPDAPVHAGAAAGRLPTVADAVASVNGVAIPRSEFDRALDALQRDRRDPLGPGDRKRILARLVDEELLLQRGLELGLARRDPKVRNDLVSAVIDTAVGDASSIEPSGEEVAAFYRDNADFFAEPGRVRARDFFVRVAAGTDEGAARARAEEIAKRLRAGEDVETVARSGDDAVTTLPDALLPPAKLVEYLGPTASRGALSLAAGQVAEPARGSDGFHVVLVLERESGDVPPLEEVETLVRSELRRRRGEQSLREYLDGLRSRARIEVREAP